MHKESPIHTTCPNEDNQPMTKQFKSQQHHQYIRIYEARTLLRLGVYWCQTPTLMITHRQYMKRGHFQIIVGVDV
ncbi:hypothetical protein QL285_013256 [Trifolium repens]|nr:hypothetical protein QL285_013256 [Trifolium repens]